MSALPVKVIDYSLKGLGYIPIVSSVSGRIRQWYGLVKVTTAIAMVALSLIGAISVMYGISFGLLISGCLDAFRGEVEKYPVYGNIACIIYDLVRFII